MAKAHGGTDHRHTRPLYSARWNCKAGEGCTSCLWRSSGAWGFLRATEQPRQPPYFGSWKVFIIRWLLPTKQNRLRIRCMLHEFLKVNIINTLYKLFKFFLYRYYFSTDSSLWKHPPSCLVTLIFVSFKAPTISFVFFFFAPGTCKWGPSRPWESSQQNLALKG